MRSAQPVLIVSSVSDAITWYQNVLGFETVMRTNDPGDEALLSYAVLLNGSAGVALMRKGSDNVAGKGACNFVTKEFEQALQSLKDAGATFYADLNEIPSGQRTFGAKDPDGNLISFVEAP